MKKVFLLALATAAVVSCKTEVSTEPIPDETNGELISLAVGSVSRAGNQGVRDLLFASGDQIGVSATKPNTTTPTDPDWADTCFDNRPALWLNNMPTDTPTSSHFVWGPAGEGGIAHNQYYLGSKKEMYIYAYYPYSTAKKNYIAPTSTTEGPKLKVDLTDGVIDGQATDVNLVQADVLYYISGNPTPPAKATVFSSASKMVSMNFNHALAQLRFVLKRPAGASAGKFVKLVFKTAKSATMDIATGAFAYDAAATYTDATYTITPKEGDVVAIPEDDGTASPFVGGLDILKATPLMIFPLALADAQKGELVLTIDFSKTADTPDTKDIPVSLASLANALVAGSLNTYTLSVSSHEIELKASITAWGTDGSDNELDAE